MKHEKFSRFVITLIGVLTNALLLSACGNTANKQKAEEENVEISSMEEADDRKKYPVYLVESIDNLHLDSEEFNIVLSCKLDAPAPCRLDAPDFDVARWGSADCLHQHQQVI